MMSQEEIRMLLGEDYYQNYLKNAIARQSQLEADRKNAEASKELREKSKINIVKYGR